MLHCLGDRLKNKDFKEFATIFISTWKKSPGVILAKTGTLKYVFVDEFQDITDNRLAVLKIIANTERTKITVIGDPNQSIYGYERLSECGKISPASYYEEFTKHYDSESLSLRINHRSLPQILERSASWLVLNSDQFTNSRPEVWGVKESEAASWSINSYVEKIQPDSDNWIVKLTDLLKEKKPNGKPYQEIAIMFRNSNELFRGYDKIVNVLGCGIRIRIQGESESFVKTREIAFIIREFMAHRLFELLHLDLDSSFQNFRKMNQHKLPVCWDFFLWDVFHACILEYRHERRENDSFESLLRYVEDFTRKDDGQLSKIYHLNSKHLSDYKEETKVMLTTKHKTKGLEFDAVMIPPSFSPMPYRQAFEPVIAPIDPTFNTRVEEERRVRYVAYSRAKYRLVEFPWKREEALKAGISNWSLDHEGTKLRGKPCSPGLEKFMLDYVAMQGVWMYNFIDSSVRQGDVVELRPNGESWNVVVHNQKVGFIRRNRTENGRLIRTLPFQAGKIIKGLRVSQILVRTSSETIKSDELAKEEARINNKKFEPFYPSWKVEARTRGYSYIVDFAGFGLEVPSPE